MSTGQRRPRCPLSPDRLVLVRRKAENTLIHYTDRVTQKGRDGTAVLCPPTGWSESATRAGPGPPQGGKLHCMDRIKKRYALCSGMPGRSLIYKDRFHRVMGVAHDAEPSDPDILGFFRRIKDGAHTIAI